MEVRDRAGRRAALLFGLAAVALGATACDDNGRSDGVASPTADASAISVATVGPTATGTVLAVATPDPAGRDGFRQFAIRALDPAVRARDAAFFQARMKIESFVCTEEDVQVAGGFCKFAGQRFDGIEVGGWRGEGGIASPDEVARTLDNFFSAVIPTESDRYGGAGPEVYAISFGEDHARAVITAIVQRPQGWSGVGPLRAAISTSWTFEGDRWLITEIIVAYAPVEELLEPVGTSYYPNWERLPAHDQGD